MNAFGIVSQERAAQELAAAGIPQQLVPSFILAERITQAIAGFLIPATVTAHAFWRL
ncbi:MAG TPA: hypothetical protein VE422_25505 [Terriglobia bacterium]|nr:hypothetical protein [Terriglobia bacterium]